jgi:hypothetical protein
VDLDKTSRISSVVVGDSQLVLQGIYGEVPWSAAIGKASGRVVASQSRGDAGFLIYGTCVPEWAGCPAIAEVPRQRN